MSGKQIQETTKQPDEYFSFYFLMVLNVYFFPGSWRYNSYTASYKFKVNNPYEKEFIKECIV